MKEFSLLFFFIFFCLGVQGQSQDKGNVFVTGVVCDRDSIRPLPEAIFRLGKEVRGVDKQGRFSLSVQVGDTLRFSHIGYVPMQVVIPDSLRENDFLLGVFMVRDTVLLSEVLILPRFLTGDYKSNAFLMNAQNNLNQAIHAASKPVKAMDQEMNRRMMIEDFARKVEMKGMVDVKLGIGTQSITALQGLMRARRQAERGKVINIEEIDLLKKKEKNRITKGRKIIFVFETSLVWAEISMNRFINNKVTFYEEFVDRIKCVIVDCCDSFVYFAFQWK